MTTSSVEDVSEVVMTTEVFRHSARTVHKIVRLNVDGMTQADSLIQPLPEGNCLNWVMGHLVCVYNNVLPLLRQEPVTAPGALTRYDRGSAPLKDATEARELSELMSLWDEASGRMDEGLATLSAQALDAPAPFSPTDNPNETVRSLLTLVAFHQAYHAGQTGILRRIIGKQGAIR